MHSTALIGFGEAGSTFAGAGGWAGAVSGYDILEDRRALMGPLGVNACATAAETLCGARIALSLVTADSALGAAQDYAPHIASDAIWCDMNSVAPETKRAAASAIEAVGGSYVDAAIMAPVQPAALDVPILLSGKRAGEAADHLAGLGFRRCRVVGEEIGRASAIKLCRSIMVKGLEALSAEMALAASKAGVLDEVLASLDASEKQVNWAERVDYNLDRMLVHGARRSAEMREAAEMIGSLGNLPAMTQGTVLLQQWLGDADTAPPADLTAKIALIETMAPPTGEKARP